MLSKLCGHAGRTCFDNVFFHLTHALEHPLSGMRPSVIHRHRLVILLPAGIKEVYPACSVGPEEILYPIGKISMMGEAYKIIKECVEKMGVKETLKDLDFKKEDIGRLTELTLKTSSLYQLLALSPIDITKQLIGNIYDKFI